MRQTKVSKFPIITAEFKNMDELAAVMETSTRTARRALSGSRPFRLQEKKRICNYLARDLSEVFANV